MNINNVLKKQLVSVRAGLREEGKLKILKYTLNVLIELNYLRVAKKQLVSVSAGLREEKERNAGRRGCDWGG
jgi:hypothetical protein